MAREVRGASGLAVELVVVSPMSRALETAAVVFGRHAQAEGGSGGGGSGRYNALLENGSGDTKEACGGHEKGLLMVRSHSESGVRASHPPISAEDAPPFLAV